jgi:hypothetical protein
MLSTSLAAVLLSGVSAVSTAGQPAWQTDYAIAVTQAAELKRPIAVFIAHGGAGYARVVAEGGLTTDDTRRLRQSYVCLYVNTDTASGKKLAEAFEMTEGLVISGKAGEKQALRHEGKVPQADLSKYLTRYAEQSGVVATTETPGVAAAPALVASAPVAATPMYAQPAPVYYPQVARPAASCST